jgi:hypothetical protein
MELQRLHIGKGERIFLDGFELRNIYGYKLEHSADPCEPAKLTVTINVDVAGTTKNEKSPLSANEQAFLIAAERIKESLKS